MWGGREGRMFYGLDWLENRRLVQDVSEVILNYLVREECGLRLNDEGFDCSEAVGES